jgi:hypothetical protein
MRTWEYVVVRYWPDAEPSEVMRLQARNVSQARQEACRVFGGVKFIPFDQRDGNTEYFKDPRGHYYFVRMAAIEARTPLYF